MNAVKFLFFGASIAHSFTYLHYVEKMLDVPYRFDMPFEGNIIDYDGNITHRRQVIHTRCYGVKLPEKGYVYFEDELISKGLLRKTQLGDSFVSCLSEEDAYREITHKLRENINYFLAQPFTEADLIHKYAHDLSKGRITHC